MEKSKSNKPQEGFSQGNRGEASKEKMQQSGNPVATMAREAQQAGSDVAREAQKAGASVAGRVQEAGSQVVHRAQEIGSQAADRADGAVSAAGRTMENMADSIRNVGPESGVVGAATGRVADTLESGGRYLEEHGLSGVVEDVADLIRRNPIPAVLVGIGIGFIIARATTRS